MPHFRLFVTLPELDEIIRDFAIKRNLVGILGSWENPIDRRYGQFDPAEQPAHSLHPQESLFGIDLIPADRIKESAARSSEGGNTNDGWIFVNPYRIVERDGSTILTACCSRAA